MAELLLGREVAAAMNEKTKAQAAALAENGVQPKLAVIRCGDREDDLSYEKSARQTAEGAGVTLESFALPETAQRQELFDLIHAINADSAIHGCLILRPLPGKLEAVQKEICACLAPEKDVDCCTPAANAALFMGYGRGFPPCTAQACMEMLAHYGISCRGKQAMVIGRSLVVGRPLAMLLLAQDATVTICHSRTENMAELCQRADIIIGAAGVPGLITKDFVRSGQVLLDVSMNWDAGRPNSRGGLGRFVGDAAFDEVEPVVAAISPVPGGVGGVTSAVLMRHVVEAAERSLHGR
ncbi:MAG: bifunctional 5,10-methylenetetrahydrofolate dehydrogenase/5,10-methenyltetrahydrofolate cyclohydrolase [Candidatus Limivicinus sp.]